MRLELKACNYPTKALRRIRLFQQRENAGKHTNREHDGDATSWDGQLSRGKPNQTGFAEILARALSPQKAIICS